MSEEEKKAIDNLFHLQHINMYLDLHTKETFKIKNKTIIKWKESVEILINSITKLQKENENLIKEKEENKFLIAMASNGMLEYNQGYSDGKNQNSNATEIIIKNRQAYVHKEEVEFLQKKIEKYKYLYQKALDNTVKADKENIQLKKQIDLMAEFMYRTGTGRRAFSCTFRKNDKCDENGCRHCIKQFFEQQAKEI